MGPAEIFYVDIISYTRSVAGGVIGAALGMFAGVAHSGWNVGNEPPPATRTVSPTVFAGAKRFHNGLAGDEFPAILKKGETVIPAGGGAGIVVNVINQGAPVDVEGAGPRFDGEKWVVDVLLKAKRRGGTPIRQLLGTA